MSQLATQASSDNMNCKVAGNRTINHQSAAAAEEHRKCQDSTKKGKHACIYKEVGRVALDLLSQKKQKSGREPSPPLTIGMTQPPHFFTFSASLLRASCVSASTASSASWSEQYSSPSIFPSTTFTLPLTGVNHLGV